MMQYKTVIVDNEKREVGYFGGEAPGAYPNGTRVVKTCWLDPVERTPVGTLGIVVGSMKIPDEVLSEATAKGMVPMIYMYWVEWDDHPGVPITCGDVKLKAVS